VQRTLAALFLVLAGAGASAGSASYGIDVGGQEIEASWHWPEASPQGLVLLQHGFSRRCANLRGLASAIAGSGWLVLCLNADMAGGNPRLARTFAQALLQGRVVAPDGGPLPQRWVAAGHSAGGAFAKALTAALAVAQPGRVARLLLLDPVGVTAVPATPTLALLAPPMACNTMQQSLPALLAAPGAEVFQLPADATHMDAEGEDTDAIARAACSPREPQPANVALLREIARRWIAGDAQPLIEAALRDGRLTSLRAARAAPAPPPAPVPDRGR
jgi:pimeloyl-ACP methyl ester carboxylesterase